MEEGGERGRFVPRKRAVELGASDIVPKGKKKDRSHRPDNAVSPWDGTRTCRPWNDPRGSRGHKEKKLKSVFSGSQDILGLAGRAVVRSGSVVWAEGTRVPFGYPTQGLSLGGTSCALCGSSSRRVLRLSHRIGFAGLFSTTAVFSPCLHLALAGPWFLGRGYDCYVRVSGTKGDVYILCQFGAHARRGTAEHPSQIYKWSQLQEDLELVAVCDALGMVQR